MNKKKKKEVKEFKKSNIENNLLLRNNTLEAKVDRRVNNKGTKYITEKEIKFKLQKYLPDIYKFYSFILRSNNKMYIDYKLKISERILDKFVPDVKSAEERPSIGNVQFIIGYDTKQIEAMQEKVIEGEVQSNQPLQDAI